MNILHTMNNSGLSSAYLKGSTFHKSRFPNTQCDITSLLNVYDVLKPEAHYAHGACDNGNVKMFAIYFKVKGVRRLLIRFNYIIIL